MSGEPAASPAGGACGTRGMADESTSCTVRGSAAGAPEGVVRVRAGVCVTGRSNAGYESPVVQGFVGGGLEPVCGLSAAGRPVVGCGKAGAAWDSVGEGPESGGEVCAGLWVTGRSNAGYESPVVQGFVVVGLEPVCGPSAAGRPVAGCGKTGADWDSVGGGLGSCRAVCAGPGVCVPAGSKARYESPVVQGFVTSGPEPVCGPSGAGRVVGAGGRFGAGCGLPISSPAAWRAGSSGGCVCATGGPKAP